MRKIQIQIDSEIVSRGFILRLDSNFQNFSFFMLISFSLSLIGGIVGINLINEGIFITTEDIYPFLFVGYIIDSFSALIASKLLYTETKVYGYNSPFLEPWHVVVRLGLSKFLGAYFAYVSCIILAAVSLLNTENWEEVGSEMARDTVLNGITFPHISWFFGGFYIMYIVLKWRVDYTSLEDKKYLRSIISRQPITITKRIEVAAASQSGKSEVEPRISEGDRGKDSLVTSEIVEPPIIPKKSSPTGHTELKFVLRKKKICEICKNKIGADEKTATCPSCMNEFHYIHFAEWVKMKGKCPICQEEIVTRSK